MSNRVSIDATQFTDTDGTTTYGFRMYDDYAQLYNNCAESDIMEMDDKELFKYVLDRSDDVSGEMFSFCHSEQKGMYINGMWRDYEEFKDILVAVYGE
jgi:hypothetical protein